MRFRHASLGTVLLALGCSSNSAVPAAEIAAASGAPPPPAASAPAGPQAGLPTEVPTPPATPGAGSYSGVMTDIGSSNLRFTLDYGPLRRGDSGDGCAGARPGTGAWMPVTIVVSNAGGDPVAAGAAGFAFTVTQAGGPADEIMSVTLANAESCNDMEALSTDDPFWDAVESDTGRTAIRNEEQLSPGGSYRLRANLLIHDYTTAAERKLFLTLIGSPPGYSGYHLAALSGGPLAYAEGQKDLGDTSSLEGFGAMVPLDGGTSPCGIFQGNHLYVRCPDNGSWTISVGY